jgi:hypothetical protein
VYLDVAANFQDLLAAFFSLHSDGLVPVDGFARPVVTSGKNLKNPPKSRVARFLLGTIYQNGENVTTDHKIFQMATN